MDERRSPHALRRIMKNICCFVEACRFRGETNVASLRFSDTTHRVNIVSSLGQGLSVSAFRYFSATNNL